MTGVLRSALTLAGIGIVFALGGQAARAADLFTPEPGANSPYDDPRYAYLYGRDGAASPPPGWTRGRGGSRDEYDDERRRPPRKTYREPSSWRTGYCTSRRVVKRRLAAGGWFHFKHAKIVDRDHVGVNANNADGGVYRLTIDRCTGRVVDARLIRGAPLRDHPRIARRDLDRYDDWRGRHNAWPVRPDVRPYAWRWQRDRWRDDWD
jgi:hypothetical protein